MRFFTAVILLFCLTFCITSCEPRYVDFFPYFDNGVPKPKVVLMPIKVSRDCPLEFADSLKDDMHFRFMDNGKIYLYSDNDVEAGLAKARYEDYFGSDISWCNTFYPADFVVLIEETEHRPYTYPSGCTLTYVLIKLRIKIIDLRHDCPRVIANELMDTCQRVSPMPGQDICDPMLCRPVYRLLAKKVVDKVESVVWSAP